MQREAVAPDLATAIELSQVFVRLVGAGFDFAPFRSAYPLQAGPTPRDPDSERLLSFATGRAFDGFALYRDIVAGNPIPGAGASAVQQALTPFRDWVEAAFGSLALAATAADPVTWRPDRLDHRFNVRLTQPGGAAVSLTAAPGPEGTLDWDSFELQAAVPSGTPDSEIVRLIPTHLRFPGMPSPRFWDFESGTTNFPDVRPDRRDVSKLAMLDLMLVHGVDWFLVHLPVELGKAVRIRALVVKDVFGGETALSPAQDLGSSGRDRFTLFSVSAESPGAAPGSLLLMPATVASSRQVGPALEEVAFTRDEMANMAWVVERAVESRIGAPWAGHERALAIEAGQPPPPAPVPADPDAEVVYKIRSKVQQNWFPLLPRKLPASVEVVLHQGTVEGRPDPNAPFGRVLRPPAVVAGQAYVLREEEVPREGVRVRRVLVRTRWVDGKTHLWLERHRGVAGAETAAGLRFDQALVLSK